MFLQCLYHDRQKQRRRTQVATLRAAVTLMEVIFAIGIIMTGLLGLAALIPIAANNAQSAMELDRSISESTSAAAAGLARQFNDLDSLVMIDREAAGSPSILIQGAKTDYAYEPTGSLQSVAFKLDSQTTMRNPGPTTFTIGKLDSPGYGHSSFGDGLQSGLCIDPLGMPDLNLLTSPFVVNTGDNAYEYSRFPYYSERYRVLSEPNAAVNPGVAAPAWPMSPRMYRVTLKSPRLGQVTTFQNHHLISASTARHIFGGFGSISPVDGPDQDATPGMLLSRTSIGGATIDSRTNLASEYSWLATLAVSPLGGDTYRQSIVVIRQRLAPVPLRSNDPLALEQVSYTVADPDENPPAERITWVANSIGFSGGVGGDVQLVGTSAISDEIEVGQWVMLSRQPHTLTPTTPSGPAVHRWYRVVRAEETVAEDSASVGWTGPNSHTVWSRWVTLAGSDWTFQDGVGDPRDTTFCTIVTGAVSVIESEVSLQ